MGQVGFQLKQTFPAGLGRLWAALGQRQYVESKYLALGSTELRILEFEVSERVIDVVVERCIRNSGNSMPAWARPLFSGAHVLHQHTRWTWVDEKRADVELEIWPLRTPVRAHGDGAVVELSARSTQMKLDLTVQCGVPAIGTQVARLFSVQMKRALGQDHRFTLSYLGLPASSSPRDSDTND